jgi:hypothetical protein
MRQRGSEEVYPEESAVRAGGWREEFGAFGANSPGMPDKQRLSGLLAIALGLILPMVGFSQEISPAARVKLMDSIRAKFDSLKGQPPAKRRELTLAFMKSLKEVSRATITPDGNVCCVFRDNMPYMILGSMVPSPGKPQPDKGAFFGASGPTLPFAEPLAVPSATVLPSAQFQGNDLPLVTRARICNTLGATFGNGYKKIRELLTSKGYQVAPGEDASLATLMNLGVNGVFVMATHGGNGYVWNKEKKDWVLDYILVSGEVYSDALEKKFTDMGMKFDGLIGTCEALYDIDPVTKKEINKRYFTISKAFIKKYWKFSHNSFVAIHACTSFNLRDVMATADVNASVYAGYNDLGVNDCWKGMVFLFDRLMGINDDAVLPHEDDCPQRPFDYSSLDTDIKKKGLYPVKFSHEGVNHSTSLQFSPGRDDFGLLAPSIKWMACVPYQRKLDIQGIFGEDPGNGLRSVTIGGTAMVVDKWTPNKITVFLPNSEEGSHGEVKVIHMGRESNSRWLCNWKGTLNVKMRGNDTLAFNAEFLLNFNSDPWSYREYPGEKPVFPMIWNAYSTMGSSCTWTALGQEKDSNGNVLTMWVGGGSPNVWLDENMGTSKTFGVGGAGDSFLKKISFFIAIMDTFAFTRSGNTNYNTPVKLGAWIQGQSMVQAKFDSDFNIFGGKEEIDDEPSRLSYYAHSGSVTWTGMQCRFPMPKTAPR